MGGAESSSEIGIGLVSLLPWWQARMGSAGETKLSGAPLTEYGLGVTLEAITLPSPAAGRRLSKVKPEHS